MKLTILSGSPELDIVIKRCGVSSDSCTTKLLLLLHTVVLLVSEICEVIQARRPCCRLWLCQPHSPSCQNPSQGSGCRGCPFGAASSPSRIFFDGPSPGQGGCCPEGELWGFGAFWGGFFCGGSWSIGGFSKKNFG